MMKLFLTFGKSSAPGGSATTSPVFVLTEMPMSAFSHMSPFCAPLKSGLKTIWPSSISSSSACPSILNRRSSITSREEKPRRT